MLVRRDGVDPAVAGWAAQAAQGHVGRARRLARDSEARERRKAVLSVPASLTSLGACFAAADQLVAAAEQEAATLSAELDGPETDALKQALGAGGTGKGAAAATRGSAGALKELERRQRSRATRAQRDALDRALVDLAAFYRDVLLAQSGAAVRPAHPDAVADARCVAGALHAGGGARPPGRGARLPRGAGAQRQTPDRRGGHDRRAPAPLTARPGRTVGAWAWSAR